MPFARVLPRLCLVVAVVAGTARTRAQFSPDRPDFLLDVELAPSPSSGGRRSNIAVVHPVFAAATPAVVDAWSSLKAAAKASLLVDRRRSEPYADPFPPSLREVMALAPLDGGDGAGGAAEAAAGAGVRGDGEEYFMNTLLRNVTAALQGVVAYAAANRENVAVFFTDDVLGNATHGGDVLLSKRPDRFVPPLLHLLADSAEAVHGSLQFVVLYPVSAADLNVFAVADALGTVTPAATDDDAYPGRTSLPVWLRSAADRIAALTTELLLLPADSYTCIPVGPSAVSSADSFGRLFRRADALLAPTSTAAVAAADGDRPEFSSLAVVREAVDRHHRPGAATAGEGGDAGASSTAGTAGAAAGAPAGPAGTGVAAEGGSAAAMLGKAAAAADHGVFREVALNLNLLHQLCSRPRR